MFPDQTEVYLNLRRSTDSLETIADPKPSKEGVFSPAPPSLPTFFEQPEVDWNSVKTKLQDEARPRYTLSLEAFPVPPIQLGDNLNSGAVILVSGRFERIEGESEETDVPEWLLDWRLFFLQESTNNFIEVDGTHYELSLLPDIPDPMKEFKYFLVLHSEVASILPPEAMINFCLDMTVRSSNMQDFMHASTSFPVQRDWLVSSWTSTIPTYQPITSPPFQDSPEVRFEEVHSPPPMTPDYQSQSPEDNSGKKNSRSRKRRRTPQEGRPRAPPSKKKRDLSEEIQKEMDKLFEEAKKLKQRKTVYAQLPAEPPPEILTENNEVKFRCPLCKKVYGRKDSCRKHIASELWEYPCSYCGIISATAQACMYHIMAKHLHMQVFDCPHCDKRFATHYALSNHQERSHPQNSTLPATSSESN